jgi:hypothetical protein
VYPAPQRAFWEKPSNFRKSSRGFSEFPGIPGKNFPKFPEIPSDRFLGKFSGFSEFSGSLVNYINKLCTSVPHKALKIAPNKTFWAKQYFPRVRVTVTRFSQLAKTKQTTGLNFFQVSIR